LFANISIGDTLNRTSKICNFKPKSCCCKIGKKELKGEPTNWAAIEKDRILQRSEPTHQSFPKIIRKIGFENKKIKQKLINEISSIALRTRLSSFLFPLESIISSVLENKYCENTVPNTTIGKLTSLKDSEN